jgi:hypothetical protein
VDPNTVEPPHGGLDFFRRFTFTADKLSISDTLVTDREWSVGRGRLLLIKGTVDAQPLREALGDEGVYPVCAQLEGEREPRALASVWINELHDSVCGSYHEYVISFDVHRSRPDVIAFRAGPGQPAYACWYNNFGDDVCEAQYLHSLYIDSPLSIAWGREMQAFPKHPDPVRSTIHLDRTNGSVQSCSIHWGEKPLLRLRTKRRFGTLGLVKESAGLLGHLGLPRVTRFLSRSAFTSHIVMPRRTAERAGRPRHYTAHIWKGLRPTAVQLWPWDPATDHLELGVVTRDSGCEDNNGLPLLRRAGFRPLSVCAIDALSAVVVPRSS